MSNPTVVPNSKSSEKRHRNRSSRIVHIGRREEPISPYGKTPNRDGTVRTLKGASDSEHIGRTISPRSIPGHPLGRDGAPAGSVRGDAAAARAELPIRADVLRRAPTCLEERKGLPAVGADVFLRHVELHYESRDMSASILDPAAVRAVAPVRMRGRSRPGGGKRATTPDAERLPVPIEARLWALPPQLAGEVAR